MDRLGARQVVSPSAQSSHSVPHRRRTVRIVKKWRIPRGAYVSLAAAAAAAALLLVLWRAFQTEELPPPHLRSARDIEVSWRCDAGHTRKSLGDVTPKPCWECDNDSYPVAKYRCPVHGTYDIAFQFREQSDGRIIPVEVRAPNGPWEPFEFGPHCSRCHREMTRETDDPLKNEGSRPVRRDGR